MKLEVWKHLANGGKVRRSDWDEGDFIHVVKNGLPWPEGK